MVCLIMLRNSPSGVDGYLRLISLLIHIHLAFQQNMSWQGGYVEDRCIPKSDLSS